MLGRPHLLDSAVRHNHNAVAQAHRLDLVMGYENGRDAGGALERFQFVAGAGAQFGIQIGKRLIQKQQPRLSDHGAGNGDALPLAAGKLTRPPVEQLINFQQPRRAFHFAADGLLVEFFAAALGAEREGDVVKDVHVRIQRIALEDHRHASFARRQPRDLLASDENLSRRGFLQPGDQAHQRGLATAGRPQNHQKFTVFDVKVNPVDSANPVKMLFDGSDFDNAHRGLPVTTAGQQ